MAAAELTPERIHKRLARLFIKAFPELDAATAPSASQETVGEWDSLMTLTLLMLADDEFSVKIGYDRIPEIRSYNDLFALIASRLA